jgi:glycosyltransferase involved in cell wall biosynthesis
MNVLFVHEVDWLKKVVFDIHTLAESLSLRSHQVYAIDYENSWHRNGSFDLGTLKTREFDGISRAFAGASVSLRRPGFIRISGLSRVSAAFTHYLEIKRTITQKNIDVIVLYSVATNAVQTINIARKLTIPVVFRSIDILNQLVSYPYLRPATRILEKVVYSRADMILTLTPTLSRYVVRLGAKEQKVKLLPMPVDTNIFCPQPAPEEIRQKWDIDKDDRVILYIGTLFDFSGLDLIVRQFPEIARQVSRAKLLIVGDGPQRRKLEGIIAEMGLAGKVVITGFEPYETMPQYINLATICLNPFLITDATRDIFPGKIVQYLACAKAVVATPLPGLLAVTPGEEQGLVFAGTPEEMAEKLVKLLKEPEYRQRLERNGLEYVRKVHSCESIAAALEARLKEAIDEKCVITT